MKKQKTHCWALVEPGTAKPMRITSAVSSLAIFLTKREAQTAKGINPGVPCEIRKIGLHFVI